MEITLKTSTIFLTIILTGLSAGLFYAWEVSVIPGTRKVSDTSYLETMQMINRAIINPRFFTIFFGSLLMLAISTFLQYKSGINLNFWMVFIALITYLVGTFGVTVFGNVPLNDALDIINLNELSSDQLEATRNAYEAKWNLWHKVRTICSVVSFAAILIAQVFFQ